PDFSRGGPYPPHMRTLPALLALIFTSALSAFGQYPADPVQRQALFVQLAGPAQEMVKGDADKFIFESPTYHSIVQGYFETGGPGKVVPKGTYTDQLTAAERAAWQEFSKSSW